MSPFAHELRVARDDFGESLGRIEALANVLFGTTSLDPEILRLNETQQSGCTVLLTGFFEEFLKNSVKAFISAIPRTGLDFEKLPKKIKETHYEAGGKVLAEVARREAKKMPQLFSGSNVSGVISRLYSPTNSGNEYYILWEAFADTKQSPNASNVADLLQRLTLSNIWPSIEGRCGDAGVSKVLQDLIDKRNECAHTGRIGSVPTPPEVLSYIDALRKISDAVVDMLDDKLNDLSLSMPVYEWR